MSKLELDEDKNTIPVMLYPDQSIENFKKELQHKYNNPEEREKILRTDITLILIRKVFKYMDKPKEFLKEINYFLGLDTDTLIRLYEDSYI
jgi:hypothetical protein